MTHQISGLYKSSNFILVFLLRFLFYKINIKKEERILLLLWQINNFLPQFNFELSRAFQKSKKENIFLLPSDISLFTYMNDYRK